MAKTKVTIKPLKINTEGLQEEILLKVGEKIVENAVQIAPTNTGNYKSLIAYDNSNMVIAQAQYSADIEYGTQAHIIEPKTKKALSFKLNGKDVVYKKVNHPGTKPNPVMRNAAKQTQKEVPAIIRQIFKERGL